MQFSSILDRPPQFEDQSQVDDGTTKCVVRDGGWRNAATHVIAAHRWTAIRSRIGDAFWGEFWLVPWGGLHAFFCCIIVVRWLIVCVLFVVVYTSILCK